MTSRKGAAHCVFRTFRNLRKFGRQLLIRFSLSIVSPVHVSRSFFIQGFRLRTSSCGIQLSKAKAQVGCKALFCLRHLLYERRTWKIMFSCPHRIISGQILDQLSIKNEMHYSCRFPGSCVKVMKSAKNLRLCQQFVRLSCLDAALLGR